MVGLQVSQLGSLETGIFWIVIGLGMTVLFVAIAFLYHWVTMPADSTSPIEIFGRGR